MSLSAQKQPFIANSMMTLPNSTRNSAKSPRVEDLLALTRLSVDIVDRGKLQKSVINRESSTDFESQMIFDKKQKNRF
jgi:hypothetical protein